MTNPVLDMLDAQKKAQPQNQAQSQQADLPTSLDDPRMDAAKKYVQSHGGNPQAAFYQLCKEKMLNPAEILNKLLKR